VCVCIYIYVALYVRACQRADSCNIRVQAPTAPISRLNKKTKRTLSSNASAMLMRPPLRLDAGAAACLQNSGRKAWPVWGLKNLKRNSVGGLGPAGLRKKHGACRSSWKCMCPSLPPRKVRSLLANFYVFFHSTEREGEPPVSEPILRVLHAGRQEGCKV